jgi:branched-chain amino acid transport system permease protein
MSILNFVIYLLTMIGIYSLLAMSLNFQVGFTGLINFGQVAFFCRNGAERGFWIYHEHPDQVIEV